MAEAERLETERLRAELAAALQRAQQQRRTTASSETALRTRLGAQCDERLREERARAEQELALLREAAAADAAEVRAGHAAELDGVRTTHARERQAWEAKAHEVAEEQKRRSAKHAERLRAVIGSEEACQVQCDALHGRLRSLAQTALALAARKRWAELEARAWATGAHALRRDVAPLEAELEASERARGVAAVAHERQLAALEGAVEEMRAQCHRVQKEERARRKEQCRAQLGAQQEQLRAELERAHEHFAAAAARREAEHRDELAATRAQLDGANAALREMEAAMREGGDALLRELE